MSVLSAASIRPVARNHAHQQCDRIIRNYVKHLEYLHGLKQRCQSIDLKTLSDEDARSIKNSIKECKYAITFLQSSIRTLKNQRADSQRVFNKLNSTI